jgi:hypothetical protein
LCCDSGGEPLALLLSDICLVDDFSSLLFSDLDLPDKDDDEDDDEDDEEDDDDKDDFVFGGVRELGDIDLDDEADDDEDEDDDDDEEDRSLLKLLN